jgi:hypothetical protein
MTHRRSLPRRAVAGARAPLAAVALGFALWTAPASAADDFQPWYAAVISGPVAKDSKLLVSLDMHVRFREDGSELDSTLFRPSVGWRVGPKLDLWLGYVDVRVRRAGRDLREERLWQQANFPLGDWFGGRVVARTRLEQRFRDGSDAGWRLRQQVRYSRAFAADKRWSLIVWDELFVNFDATDFGQRSGFDQNRAFVGAGFQPHPRLRIEAGYMNQRIRRPGPTPDRTVDIAQVTFVVPL